MFEFGDYETDVRYDFAFAEQLVRDLRAMSASVKDYEAARASAESTAKESFNGAFADVFSVNMSNAHLDNENLSLTLEAVADKIEEIAEEARKENLRRQHIRDYVAEHDDWWERIWDWFAGAEISPFPDEIKPSVLDQTALPLHPRDHSRTGKDIQMGVSSAVPEKLRTAATIISGACDRVTGVEVLAADLLEYPSVCQYATVEVGDLPQNLKLWIDYCRADVDWLNAIAQAFESAGGTGGLAVTLSDSALVAMLDALGIQLFREPLQFTSPTLSGLDPSTGYVLDPVNATTGSFIEPETDLSFTGGSAGLTFSRMYNSVGESGGVFGPHWTSILDQHIIFDGDAVRWVRDDGRHILFPANNEGPQRAAQDNYWCERVLMGLLPDFIQSLIHDDEACFVISGNQGERWFYTLSGVWLGQVFATGLHIVALSDEQGRIVSLRHQLGRVVDCDYAHDRCVAIRANDGQHCSYAYDDEGRLIAASSARGTRRYVLEEHGLIGQVISAEGVREVTNTYDDNGRVVAQITDMGRHVRFSYLPGGVTEVSDHDGSRANTWISNAQGRLAGVVDTDGKRQSMSYDKYGNLVAATARDGKRTVHFYDDRGRRVRTVMPNQGEFTFNWDHHDRLVGVVAGNGATVRYVYADGTSAHQPVSIIDPVGGETELTWQAGLLRRVVDPMGVSVSFDYDSFGDLLSLTNGVGDVMTFVRDASGRVVEIVAPDGGVTRFAYDDRGNCIKVEHADGAQWFYEFDGLKLVAVVDPCGGRTEVGYDEDGHIVSVTDPLGRTIRQFFDDCGNVSSLVLPDGANFSYVHDDLSRLREIHTPDGAVWSQEWDEVGQLKAQVDPTGVTQRFLRGGVSARPSTDDPESLFTSDSADVGFGVEFDQYGRPVRWGAQADEATSVRYDLGGNPVEVCDAAGAVTVFRRDRGGRVVEMISAEGVSTRYSYDACGRVSAVHDAFGVTQFEYDSNSRVVKRVLPTGEESRFVYDAVGRVVDATVPGFGRSTYRYDLCGRVVFSCEPLTGIRRFSYDSAGQLVRVFNGVGGATSYEYDERGHVVAVILPSGGVIRRSYDQAGRLIAVTDPLGNVTRATYDAAGRLLTQLQPDGVELSFEYDGAGARVGMYADGRLLSRIERDRVNRRVRLLDYTHPDKSLRSHVLSYDHAGRLLSRSVEFDGHVEVATWEYDADGRRVAFVDMNGLRTSYRYDDAGRLVTISHPRLGELSLEYDAAGRLVSSHSPACVKRWEYGQGRVVSRFEAPGACSAVFNVSYDTWGRVSEVHDGETVFSYVYDDAHQLCRVQTGDGVVTECEYDQAGRLIRRVSGGVETSFTYDAASQLIQMVTGSELVSYSYDSRGRRVRAAASQGNEREFVWDDLDRLSSVSDCDAGSASVSHVFWVDALGELRSIDDVSLTWDSASRFQSLTSVGSEPVLNVPGGGVLGVCVSGDLSGVAAWRMSRESGQVNPWEVQDYACGPAGAGIRITGNAAPVVAGLEWMGERIYDSGSFKFLTRDPLVALPGGVWESDPYNYAANNPLNLVDPFGLSPVTDAQLNEYNDAYGAAAWRGVTDWLGNNWEYLAGAALMVAGAALLLIPGLGTAAGIAVLAASGALMSAGTSMLIQKYENGSVSLKELAIDTAVGAVGGAFGGGAAAIVGRKGAGMVLRKVAESAAGNLAAPVADVALRGQSFGHAVTNYVTSTATGVGGGKLNRILVDKFDGSRWVSNLVSGGATGVTDAMRGYAVESYFAPNPNASLGFRSFIGGVSGAGSSLDSGAIFHPNLPESVPSSSQGTYTLNPDAPGAQSHIIDNTVYRHGDVYQQDGRDVYKLPGEYNGHRGTFYTVVETSMDGPTVVDRKFVVNHSQ